MSLRFRCADRAPSRPIPRVAWRPRTRTASRPASSRPDSGSNAMRYYRSRSASGRTAVRHWMPAPDRGLTRPGTEPGSLLRAPRVPRIPRSCRRSHPAAISASRPSSASPSAQPPQRLRHNPVVTYCVTTGGGRGPGEEERCPPCPGSGAPPEGRLARGEFGWRTAPAAVQARLRERRRRASAAIRGAPACAGFRRAGIFIRFHLASPPRGGETFMIPEKFHRPPR